MVVRSGWHSFSMKAATIFAIFLLGCSGSSISAETVSRQSSPVSCPADLELARLTAASEIVLIGTPAVPVERLTEEAQKAHPHYVEVPIRVETVVKGDDVADAVLRFYPQDVTHAPSVAAVVASSEIPVVLFLVRDGSGAEGLYFAGYTPGALAPATKEWVDAVRAEVERQQTIIRTWRNDRTLALYEKVRKLVARLGRVQDEEQQEVFDRLERLGKAAVPAIVAQMDDRRRLKTRAIVLVNHASDAWERTRHYRPEEVVDGLAAVLGQITHRSFGSIENGANARKRDATVVGWRIYAADLACSEGPMMLR